MIRTVMLLAVLGSVLPSTPAAAQSEGRFAVGFSLSAKGGTDEATSGHVNPGLLWRFGHGRDGWGWEYGLSWYSADLHESIQSSATDFGELHVRPLLGGYGYGKRFGRTSTMARVLGGYAFTSFELSGSFGDSYQQALGAEGVRTEVSNTFVVKPEVSAWVDLSRKIGLNVSLGYIVARPEVSVISSIGRDSRRINADMVMFKVGAVYSIF